MFNAMVTQAPPDLAEELRAKIGMSKAKFDVLLKRYSLEELDALYETFLEGVRRAIAWEFKAPALKIDGAPYASTIQAARALGVGEFHLANLRYRQKLNGHTHGRKTIYAKRDLEALLKPQKDRRSPIAASFIRWLDLREAS